MITGSEAIKSIFGEKYVEIVSISHSIEAKLGVYEYDFMAADDFAKLIKIEPLEAIRIYWLEILYRCHFCASATLMRSNRWANGVISAYNDQNYFSFCANLRGFLESSADSYEGIGNVAASLAGKFRAICQILAKDPAAVIVSSPAIQDQLIHFSHGRKVGKGEQVPDTHKAKHVRDYLALFDTTDKSVNDLYGDLCEVTHPASSSVSAFASVTERGDVHLIVPDDKKLIDGIIVRHLKDAWYLFDLSINPALVLLKFLNYFKVDEVKTPALEEVDLTNIQVWREIVDQIG